MIGKLIIFQCCSAINTAKLVVFFVLCFLLQRNFGFFCSIYHLSAPLRVFLGNTWYLVERVHKVMVFNLWLVDFNLFVLFLCFKEGCLWSSHNQLVCFKDWFFWPFLFFSLARIYKAISASFHRQKFHSPSWFPSPSSQFCFCGPYRWSRKTQNPFEVCKMCSAIQQIWQ